MKRWIFFLSFFVLLSAVFFSSCGLTRIAETKSEYYQKGDTTVQIMTRTSTTIDAKTTVPIQSFIR